MSDSKILQTSPSVKSFYAASIEITSSNNEARKNSTKSQDKVSLISEKIEDIEADQASVDKKKSKGAVTYNESASSLAKVNISFDLD